MAQDTERFAADIIAAHLEGVCAVSSKASDAAFARRDALRAKADGGTFEEVRRIGRAVSRLGAGE